MSNLSTMNGCFQKPSVFPRTMLNPRQVLFGIILFLGISFSPMVNNDVLEANITAETTQFDENHDKLVNAAENWHQASSKTIDGLTVKELVVISIWHTVHSIRFQNFHHSSQIYSRMIMIFRILV